MRKIIFLILTLSAFPSYSKNILPNVQGTVRIEDTELIFTLERVLFSYPFYITGYEITFEEYDKYTKVYISLLFTNLKTKKTINVKNEKTGKYEIRIPREGKLKSSNLLFFYKDDKGITELAVEKTVR
ncbi:hypothetical protein HRI97_06485 [Treponema socranskii subsp. buccale]|uniref:hypothetical protein n=1 Tax=Treponema socranskii TaxID=53419 RepID=UPI0020A2F734|nr:hypothetical protein [Treponema socranskii]UTD02734.1 hypothetical protein HRI97_06485 [Treponema socranskii subsp. buccale]